MSKNTETTLVEMVKALLAGIIAKRKEGKELLDKAVEHRATALRNLSFCRDTIIHCISEAAADLLQTEEKVVIYPGQSTYYLHSDGTIRYWNGNCAWKGGTTEDIEDNVIISAVEILSGKFSKQLHEQAERVKDEEKKYLRRKAAIQEALGKAYHLVYEKEKEG